MSSPFTHERRRRFSPRERAEIFAAAGGKCANCGRKIPIGEQWDLDHYPALCRGGTNDDVRVLCELCHGAKTPVDLSEGSKMKNIYERQHVPAKYRKSRAWGRR